ncbi:MAG TPA: MEDS domain-containing protein [Acidimicrobiales bacterium]|nr:MEDS domain-containing protein [Acidimicrobiales bacterium]
MLGAPVVNLGKSNPGLHLCAFYPGQEELEKVGGTFVRAGLAAGDRVLYLSAARDPASVCDALETRGVDSDRAVQTGRLVIQRIDEVYGSAGSIDLDDLAWAYRDAGRRARSDGFPGLRVAAEMGDFPRLVGSIDLLLAWERFATQLQAEEGITSVCQYDLADLSAEEVSLLDHEHAGHSPVHAALPMASFMLTREPFGLSIAGEVDVSNRTVFARALTACAQGNSSFSIDVEQLEFADVGFLEVIFGLARKLPADGMIRIPNATNRLKRLIAVAGLKDPRVVVET